MLYLTKPMRVKLNAVDVSASFLGRRVWPTNKSTDVEEALCVIVDGYDKWHTIRKHDLENIPESVKHLVYIRASGDKYISFAADPDRPPSPDWVGILVWSDGEGKTMAEVAKRGQNGA